MYDTSFVKPKKRTVSRVMFGRFVYTMLRYLQWLKYGKAYAKQPDGKARAAQAPEFSFVAAAHKTPLYRNLQNDDLELQKNKVHNLSLAIARMDGVILPPTGSMSYWKLIGAPIALRGFRKGMVLVNGTVDAYTGGGLCQLSNLLYWMTLHTPLSVSERYRHSYDVFPDTGRTQPFGSGATCVYNYRDLQIRNDHVEPYRLRLWLEAGFLHGEWRTRHREEIRYEVYESRHWITQGGPGLYIRNNELKRRAFRGVELLEDAFVAENHALMMYSPLLAPPVSFAPAVEGSHT